MPFGEHVVHLLHDRLEGPPFPSGEDINLALEPEAAAYFFARRLEKPATVLVADFGGGTSDFSIVKFDPRTGATQALAHAGVGIAGDTLDYRIIDKVIAPAFGKAVSFGPKINGSKCRSGFTSSSSIGTDCHF